jgi:hypothetical protein
MDNNKTTYFPPKFNITNLILLRQLHNKFNQWNTRQSAMAFKFKFIIHTQGNKKLHWQSYRFIEEINLLIIKISKKVYWFTRTSPVICLEVIQIWLCCSNKFCENKENFKRIYNDFFKSASHTLYCDYFCVCFSRFVIHTVMLLHITINI